MNRRKLDIARLGPALAVTAAVLMLGLAWAQPAANRKVFKDSVIELPAQPTTFRGMMVNAARPEHMTEKMELLFSLQIPDEARKRMEEAVASGKVIPRDQLKRDIAPKQADVDKLTDYLKDQGFEITKVTNDRTGVYARATAAQIEKTLQVQMVRVFRDGVSYTAARNAPSMREDVASGVRAIVGLQPFRHAHKHSRFYRPSGGGERSPRTVSPATAKAPAPSTANAPPYLVQEILKAYNAENLAVSGSGETIAILIDTAPLKSDLRAFWAQNGLTIDPNQIETVNVSRHRLPPQEGEETLDVEWASGVAPGAKIRVYASGSLQFVDLDKALDAIVDDLDSQPTMRQLSISLGLGETFLGGPDGEVATQHQKFLTLAAAGVNVFVSSGDAGSHPDDTGHDADGPLQAEYSASDTAVIGVGGTRLTLNSSGAPASESGWDGSGGGVSMFFGRPAWQSATGVPPGSKRLVPDVSLVASPNTGALIIFQGNPEQIGGTSWSAPTWAGFCALMNEARARAGKPPLPYLNPLIYPLAGTSCFRDINTGTNGPDGQYDAGSGYDLVTGIGVPDVRELIRELTK
jgi:kumamolisin